jgi:hypothetical protein
MVEKAGPPYETLSSRDCKTEHFGAGEHEYDRARENVGDCTTSSLLLSIARIMERAIADFPAPTFPINWTTSPPLKSDAISWQALLLANRDCMCNVSAAA